MKLRKFLATALAVCALGTSAIMPASAVQQGYSYATANVYNHFGAALKGTCGTACIDYNPTRHTGLVVVKATANITAVNNGMRKPNSFDVSTGSGYIYGVKSGSYTNLAYNRYWSTNTTIGAYGVETYRNVSGFKYNQFHIVSYSRDNQYKQNYYLNLYR